MYTRNTQIFVRINRNGHIPHLGINGPVPNPIKVSCGVCFDMVSAGLDVHQVDPVTKKMIKLTTDNIFDDKKFEKLKDDETTGEYMYVPKVAVDKVASMIKDVNKNQTIDKESSQETIQFTGVKKEEVSDPIDNVPKTESLEDQIPDTDSEINDDVHTEELVNEASDHPIDDIETTEDVDSNVDDDVEDSSESDDRTVETENIDSEKKDAPKTNHNNRNKKKRR